MLKFESLSEAVRFNTAMWGVCKAAFSPLSYISTPPPENRGPISSARVCARRASWH